jgi:hypothetical protein
VRKRNFGIALSKCLHYQIRKVGGYFNHEIVVCGCVIGFSLKTGVAQIHVVHIDGAPLSGSKD